MSKKSAFILIILMLTGLFLVPEARAANSADYLIGGIAQTVGSVFAIPVEIVKDSTQVMFPLGIVTGTVKGALKTVGGVLSGAFNIARGAAPLAKYGLLFL